MKMTDLVTKAHRAWINNYSPYICDCFTQYDTRWIPNHYKIDRSQEDKLVAAVEDAVKFIADQINHKYSAEEFLFPGNKYHYELSAEQTKEVEEFRTDLWKKLAEFAEDYDRGES